MAASRYSEMVNSLKESIKNKEKALEIAKRYGDAQYPVLFDLMCQRAELENLELLREAEMVLSGFKFPPYSGDLKPIASDAVKSYRHQIDSLRKKAPLASVSTTPEQTRVLTDLERAYSSLREMKQIYYNLSLNPDSIPHFKTICQIITWWNEEGGQTCRQCGEIEILVPRSIPDGIHSRSSFEIVHHQIGNGSFKWDDGIITFRCALANPSIYQVDLQRQIPLSEGQISDLRVQIASTQQELEEVKGLRGASLSGVIRDLEVRRSSLQRQITQDERTRVMSSLIAVFNNSPLGHKLCYLPEILTMIDTSSPATISSPAPAPAPYTSYIPREQRQKPEWEAD